MAIHLLKASELSGRSQVDSALEKQALGTNSQQPIEEKSLSSDENLSHNASVQQLENLEYQQSFQQNNEQSGRDGVNQQSQDDSEGAESVDKSRDYSINDLDFDCSDDEKGRISSDTDIVFEDVDVSNADTFVEKNVRMKSIYTPYYRRARYQQRACFVVTRECKRDCETHGRR